MKNIFFFLLSILISFPIYAQLGAQFEWVKTYSQNSPIGGVWSVAQDSEANVYSTGLYYGSSDFDPGVDEFILNAYDSSAYNLYIQKLDADGEFIWAKTIGNQNSLIGNSQIIIDEEGDIIVSFSFQDTLDLDPGPDSSFVTPSTDGTCIFVVKLNSDGEFIWGNMLECSESSYVGGIKTDDSGNILITGGYIGTLDADPSDDVFNLSEAGANVYILKWDNNGSFIWAKSLTADVFGLSSNALETDSNGNVLITGQYRDTVDFDPGLSINNQISNGNTDVFLLKLNSDGDFVWVNSYGSEEKDQSHSVCVDSFNNVFISGTFEGSISFDSTTEINSNGEEDVFILKTDSNGSYAWAKTFGNTGHDKVYSMQMDNSESLYTTGSYSGTIDIDPNEAEYVLNSDGGYATYLQKIDDNGNFTWAISLDFVILNYDEPVSVGEENEIYIVSSNFGETDFDPSDEEYILDIAVDESFVLKLLQDSCSSFALFTDSISSISCTESAYISVQGSNGVEPYAYEWATLPTIELNSISIENPGMYSVTVTDSNQCVRTATYLINGPMDESGFDLNANLIASEFQPGFSSNVMLDGLNSACDYVSGEMILIFDDLLLFDSSLTQAYELTGDSLVWDFTDLNYDTEHILAQCFFTTSELAVIGDTICFDLIINPYSNDLDSSNNVNHYCYPIINGYDPNDKQVYPQGECEENYTLLDETLTYTIRFQNTGNSEAINIHILDQLSPYLNINSVNVIASSHEMHTEVKNGNVLDFIFNEINLPDSSSDFNASQGYVIFEIDPIMDLPEYSVIYNESNIYFDYNPPVLTNMVFNTMVNTIPLCSVTSIEEQEQFDKSILLYPNPSSGIVNVDLSGLEDASISVFSSSGQLVYQKENIHGELFQFELNAKAGSYILMLSTEGENRYVKLLKY